MVTFRDLKWPWWHDEGSPVTIFRLRMSILPVVRCLRVFWMVFVQKRRLSFFSPWLIMERSQNWPDIRSPISKFRYVCFIDTGADINRWKFQGNRSVGVALTSIQTFYEVRSLDVTWWPDLAWPGSEIFTTYAEKMYVFWPSGKNGGGGSSGHLKKKLRGLSRAPPPSGRRLNKWNFVALNGRPLSRLPVVPIDRYEARPVPLITDRRQQRIWHYSPELFDGCAVGGWHALHYQRRVLRDQRVILLILCNRRRHVV